MLLGTISFFDTISTIWRNALEAGFTLRGAADCGHIFWNEKEIIGPSFIKTYRLEQSHAKSSRVIISSALNKTLEQVFNQHKTFWNDEILKIVRKDIDGFLILNPHTLYSTKEEGDLEHVLQLLTELQKKANPMNREKYSPILAILNTENTKLSPENLGKY
ncbi:hypothetical protein [Ekhidna sp. To15]|uniref:hypothetical protein n=1 Tax=Ekhidna sp. To15 TaxID=3395267 RepID=UPI003F520F61